MYPQLEVVDSVIRILGWPTLLGLIVWAVRTWDSSQRQLQEIDKNAKDSVETIAAVRTDVDSIKNNHLAHLQDGIIAVAASNDKAVTILQNIDAGIKILIDRTPRV